MDSLANYGTDDDYESSDEKLTEWHHHSNNIGKQEDANYEEVQMELSEDSDDGPIKKSKENQRTDSSSDDEGNVDSPKYTRHRDWYRREARSRSREIDSRDDDRGRDMKDDIRPERYSQDDRNYRRGSHKDRNYHDRERRRSISRERRRSVSRERRRSVSRERRRSSSRDRRRSSSRDRYRRSPRRERSRRSRSRSWSRYKSRRRSYSRNSRNDFSETSTDNLNSMDKNRFFMPGITGKYREQIEKRKLLWQKKEGLNQGENPSTTTVNPLSDATTSRVTKIWEATTFAQDQDGKVASKFKRLMGIKAQADSTQAPRTDIIRKQEEMFTSMEQQYEVARTATHTMRGVGLGFTTSYTR